MIAAGLIMVAVECMTDKPMENLRSQLQEVDRAMSNASEPVSPLRLMQPLGKRKRSLLKRMEEKRRSNSSFGEQNENGEDHNRKSDHEKHFHCWRTKFVGKGQKMLKRILELEAEEFDSVLDRYNMHNQGIDAACFALPLFDLDVSNVSRSDVMRNECCSEQISACHPEAFWLGKYDCKSSVSNSSNKKMENIDIFEKIKEKKHQSRNRMKQYVKKTGTDSHRREADDTENNTINEVKVNSMNLTKKSVNNNFHMDTTENCMSRNDFAETSDGKRKQFIFNVHKLKKPFSSLSISEHIKYLAFRDSIRSKKEKTRKRAQENKEWMRLHQRLLIEQEHCRLSMYNYARSHQWRKYATINHSIDNFVSNTMKQEKKRHLYILPKTWKRCCYLPSFDARRDVSKESINFQCKMQSVKRPDDSNETGHKTLCEIPHEGGDAQYLLQAINDINKRHKGEVTGPRQSILSNDDILTQSLMEVSKKENVALALDASVFELLSVAAMIPDKEVKAAKTSNCLKFEIPVTVKSITCGKSHAVHKSIIFDQALPLRTMTNRQKQRLFFERAISDTATSSYGSENQFTQDVTYSTWTLQTTVDDDDDNTFKEIDLIVRSYPYLKHEAMQRLATINVTMEYLYEDSNYDPDGWTSEEMTYDEKIRYWASLFLSKAYNTHEEENRNIIGGSDTLLLLSHVSGGSQRPKLLKRRVIRLNKDENDIIVNDYDNYLQNRETNEDEYGCDTPLSAQKIFNLIQRLSQLFSSHKDGKYLLVKSPESPDFFVYESVDNTEHMMNASSIDREDGETVCDCDSLTLPPLPISTTNWPVCMKWLHNNGNERAGTKSDPGACFDLYKAHARSGDTDVSTVPYIHPHWKWPKAMYGKRKLFNGMKFKDASCRIPFTYEPLMSVPIYSSDDRIENCKTSFCYDNASRNCCHDHRHCLVVWDKLKKL